MRFASHNPVFRKIIDNPYEENITASATYKGVAAKTLYFVAMILLGVFGGLFVLFYVSEGLFTSLLTASLVTTIISALLAFWFPRLSSVFGTVYCLGEGVLVGVVSMAFEIEAPGVVLTALMSTIVVLIVVATLFLTRLIVVNSKFIRFLLIFAISVLVSQILMWILSRGMGVAYDFWTSLFTSGIMVFLGTLYLLFDFENIRRIVENHAPKDLEWYASFGLVFTVVWLYMEILPIIARIFFNRD